MPGICSYPLPPLAQDARLFMWRVGAMQQEALDVMKAWGFTLKAELVWVKTTQDGVLILDEGGDVLPTKRAMANHGIVCHDNLANIHFGMGHQVRYSHEVCLIGVRGHPDRLKHIRSVFFAPAGEHSEKPDLFYKLVEQMSPGPYYSLFSRKRRPNWWVDGDELDSIEFMAKLARGVRFDRERSRLRRGVMADRARRRDEMRKAA